MSAWAICEAVRDLDRGLDTIRSLDQKRQEGYHGGFYDKDVEEAQQQIARALQILGHIEDKS